MPIITIKTTKFELDILPDGSYYIRRVNYEGMHITPEQLDDMLQKYFDKHF